MLIRTGLFTVFAIFWPALGAYASNGAPGTDGSIFNDASNATNATAPVPALRYDSVFSSKPASAVANEATQATPDRGWKQANDEVGRLGGHAGHLRDAVAKDPSGSSANALDTKTLGSR